MIGGATGGARLNLMLGETVVRPANAATMRAFRKAEIAVSDTNPCGFSIEFESIQTGLAGMVPLLQNSTLKAGLRLVATAQYGLNIEPVLDGIIQEVVHKPAENGQVGTITVKGRDLTVLMDKEMNAETFEGMSAPSIVLDLLKTYSRYGIVPKVIPPKNNSPDNPLDRTPALQGTPLSIILHLAKLNGFVFRLTPGPFPLTSTAYWGPATLPDNPLKAITTDMGAATNVSNLEFQNAPNRAAVIKGDVLDQSSGVVVPIRSFPSGRMALGVKSALTDLSAHRTELLKQIPGQGTGAGLAQAQSQSEATDDTLTATGEVDLARYGSLLKPARLVGLRGAGWDLSGLYRVRDVIHTIEPGRWNQSFTLARNGTGATVPLVAV